MRGHPAPREGRRLDVAWLFVRKSPNHLTRHEAHIRYLRDDSIEAD